MVDYKDIEQKIESRMITNIHELRQDVDKRYESLSFDIKENTRKIDEMRDINITTISAIRAEISDIRLSIANSLSDIKIAVSQGQVNGKWHKTLIWFVFVEIFVVVLGAIVAVIAGALVNTIK